MAIVRTFEMTVTLAPFNAGSRSFECLQAFE